MKKKQTQETKNNLQEEVTWGGLLNEFLWTCAGADKEILRQCPTDYAKYAGIGGTILFTALMAALSGGYAMFTVFDVPAQYDTMGNLINATEVYDATGIAIAFAIFWGLLIFNLDRLIVNTMYSDGSVDISWKELRSALPRIIMAIFLGIVISTPLEMKIFEDRIESQLVKDNIKRTTITRQEAEDDYKLSDTIQSQLNKLQIERKELANKLGKAQEDRMKEEEGTALSGAVGRGPIWRAKKEYEDQCQARLNDWDAHNNADMERLTQQLEYVSRNIREMDIDIKKGQAEKGFCVRYEAFSNIKKESKSLNIVSIVIMLLFIIIEIAPTIIKMMIGSGPYDDLLRSEMHRARVLSDKRISDLNDEINTAIQISTEKNRNKLEAEVKANQELLQKIAHTQSELLTEAIKHWRAEEMKKIKEQPSAYIKTSGKTTPPTTKA